MEENEYFELINRISNLEAKVICGLSGHVFSVNDEGDGWVAFRCLRCAVTYSKNKDCLTDHEKKLVEATFGK